jgi:anti-anti-sigma regulatory factor
MTAVPLTIQESHMFPLVAPSRLTAEHRLEFRRQALEMLEAATRTGAPVVEVDLGATVEIDASGLGVLILLQKRAREAGLRTRLLRVPGIVSSLLDSTRLNPLFDFDSV